MSYDDDDDDDPGLGQAPNMLACIPSGVVNSVVWLTPDEEGQLIKSCVCVNTPVS